MAARRAGFTPPPQTEPAPAPPSVLSPDERRLVGEALALLDRTDAAIGRFSGETADWTPSRADAEAAFSDGDAFVAVCKQMPSGHPALSPLLDAGMTYVAALRLRFIARGWHDVLGMEPGAPAHVRQVAERYRAPTSHAGQVADYVWRHARDQRDRVADLAHLPPRTLGRARRPTAANEPRSPTHPLGRAAARSVQRPPCAAGACAMLSAVPRYFVTGATGFVGAEVAKQLLTRGHRVVALVRSLEKAALLKMLGAELHAGDITEPESLRAAMHGVDGVFHVAGWYRTGAPKAAAVATAINVTGTRHVLDVMRELGIPKGVYTSTLAVFSDTHGALVDESYRYDGPHLSVYDRSKWEAHYEVALPAMAAGLPLVVVQPGVVYGPGDTSAIRGLFVRHLRRRLPAVPARTAYCWGHIEDTAQAHIDAMEQGVAGECYIIAGPPHTLREALVKASAYSGRAAPFVGVPPWLLGGVSKALEAVESLVDLPPGLSAETLRVLAGATYLGSHAKATRQWGFAPRPLDEGLRHLVEHEMRVLGMAPRV